MRVQRVRTTKGRAADDDYDSPVTRPEARGLKRTARILRHPRETHREGRAHDPGRLAGRQRELLPDGRCDRTRRFHASDKGGNRQYLRDPHAWNTQRARPGSRGGSRGGRRTPNQLQTAGL